MSRALQNIFILVFSSILLFVSIYCTNISTNIFNSFNSSFSDGHSVAGEKFESNVSRSVVMLIPIGNDDHANVESISRTLKDSNLFEEIFKKIDLEDNRRKGEYVLNNIHFLLNDSQMKLILDNKMKLIKDEALLKIYSPFGTGSSLINEDPLSLMFDFFSQINIPINVTPRDGLLYTHSQKYLFMSISIKHGLEDKAFRLFTTNQSFQRMGLKYLSPSFFAQQGKQSARFESQLFSLLSVVLIVLLFFLSFRSYEQLLLSISIISISTSIGLLCLKIFFIEVHLFSILLGVSVLGVIADYLIHYFIKESNTGYGVNFISTIKTPLKYSLFTSAFGFIVMWFSNVIVLQQLSVFALATLLSTFLFVLYFLPLFRTSHLLDKKRMFLPYRNYVRFFSGSHKIGYFLFFASFLLGMFIYSNVDLNENVQSFSQLRGDLFSFENEIRKELGLKKQFGYFIIRGKSQDEVLSNEETLIQKLKKEEVGYNAFSTWFPSQSKQRQSLESFARLSSVILDLSHILKLGSIPYQLAVDKSQISFKEVEDLGIDKGLLALRLGNIDEHFYNIVPVYKNLNNVKNLESTNVKFSNKVMEINQRLSLFKGHILSFILIFLSSVFLFLCYKHGLVNTVFLLTPAMFSMCFSWGIVLIVYNELNLFHLLAGLLILTLSFDYSAFNFFSNDKDQSQSDGILLSSISTIVSFGVLAFSETHAVSSFGLVVCLGICCSLALCPLSVRFKQ